MLVSIYIDTENNIPTKRLHRYGYVIETVIHDQAHTVSGLGEVDDSYYATVLTALKDALSRITKNCELMIVTRNSRVGYDLTHNMHDWQENGWRKKDGKTVSGAECWKSVADRLKTLEITEISQQNMNRHPYSSWIQSEIKRKIMNG